MKKIISIISAVLLASHLVSAQTLPDVKVEDISGETVSIRSVVKDKPAIISFWGGNMQALHCGTECFERCHGRLAHTSGFRYHSRVCR